VADEYNRAAAPIRDHPFIQPPAGYPINLPLNVRPNPVSIIGSNATADCRTPGSSGSAGIAPSTRTDTGSRVCPMIARWRDPVRVLAPKSIAVKYFPGFRPPQKRKPKTVYAACGRRCGCRNLNGTALPVADTACATRSQRGVTSNFSVSIGLQAAFARGQMLNAFFPDFPVRGCRIGSIIGSAGIALPVRVIRCLAHFQARYQDGGTFHRQARTEITRRCRATVNPLQTGLGVFTSRWHKLAGIEELVKPRYCYSAKQVAPL